MDKSKKFLNKKRNNIKSNNAIKNKHRKPSSLKKPKYTPEKDYSDYEEEEEVEEEEQIENEENDNVNSNGNHELKISKNGMIDERQVVESKSIDPQVKISKNICQQQELFYSLVGIRILLQDIVKSANILPLSSYSKSFQDKMVNPQILTSLKNTLESTIINFKNLIKKIIYKTNKPLLLEDKKGELALEKDASSKNFLVKFCNKILDKWYIQSVSNINSNSIGYTNNILENIDTYYEGYIKKQNKSDSKIMGLTLQGNAEVTKKEIYQDDDYYDLLLKDFINFNSSLDLDNIDDSFDPSKVEGLLQQEALIKLTGKTSKNKVTISNKFSKDKKISHEKHEKLLNFMIPLENPDLFVGRDEVIRKLFGFSWELNKDYKDNKLKKVNYNNTSSNKELKDKKPVYENSESETDNEDIEKIEEQSEEDDVKVI